MNVTTEEEFTSAVHVTICLMMTIRLRQNLPKNIAHNEYKNRLRSRRLSNYMMPQRSFSHNDKNFCVGINFVQILSKSEMWDLFTFRSDVTAVENVFKALKSSMCDKFVDTRKKHNEPIRSNDRINFSNEVTDTSFCVLKKVVKK